jgi:N6-L-threonylcarbamoyladenine synthase
MPPSAAWCQSARAHVDLLDGIVDSAMKVAGVGFAELSAVAAAGPGLIGGVIAGLITAAAIAMVHDTPLTVNHLDPCADAAGCLRAGVSYASLRLRRPIVAVASANVRLGTIVDDAWAGV